MGRLMVIDSDKLDEILNEHEQNLTNNLVNIFKKHWITILTELQLEIEEMSGLVTEIHGEEWNEINVIHSQDVLSLIQQKIDKLKE